MLRGAGRIRTLNHVIEKLLKVQEVDAQAAELRVRLAAGPRRIEEKKIELSHHEAVFREAETRMKEAQRIAERKNGEVDAIDRKIRDLYAKLNTARSNKEYEALKTEIAGQKADREILEEEALLQWGVEEDRKRQAGTERRKAEALGAELEEVEREWEREKEVLDGELAELEALRAGRLEGIPPTWMDRYDRLLASIGIPVLVPVVEQYCQGCQMNVSIHDVTRAWKASEVVQCRSCSRILYAETL